MCCILSVSSLFAQAILPDFTVKNTNGKITIFWMNNYEKPVKGISIQRSYDSTKKFSSIASITKPQSTVNGFTDSMPPYNKMYYRLFIGFDSGEYIFTKSKRPELNTILDYSQFINNMNVLYEKNMQLQEENQQLKQELAVALAVKNKPAFKPVKPSSPVKTPVEPEDSEVIVKKAVTYPSKRIFTDKDNNVVAMLNNARTINYRIRFLTEDNKLLFEIKNPAEDYFVIEKVNFIRAGWYLFELYESENLLEENKFYISNEEKKSK